MIIKAFYKDILSQDNRDESRQVSIFKFQPAEKSEKKQLAGEPFREKNTR